MVSLMMTMQRRKLAQISPVGAIAPRATRMMMRMSPTFFLFLNAPAPLRRHIQSEGCDLGITAVLHTWGQKLDFHHHLHCIVTGGALSPDGKQWHSHKQRKFLFPVQALAALFRGKFLAGLRQMLGAQELHLPDSELKTPATRARWLSLLYTKRWVLYAKRPFGGPQQVLRYLANYTHRVALSNRRIVAVDPQQQTVTFTYRDYRHGSKLKELTLCALEFIRRFSLHILPSGLVRIRHYGILGNNRRKRDIE